MEFPLLPAPQFMFMGFDLAQIHEGSYLLLVILPFAIGMSTLISVASGALYTDPDKRRAAIFGLLLVGFAVLSLMVGAWMMLVFLPVAVLVMGGILLSGVAQIFKKKVSAS